MLWESRYQMLCDSIDHGYCVIRTLFDDQGRCVDYEFLETNRNFKTHTGLVDALGKRVRELVPDLERHWFDTYGRVALTGEKVRFVHEAKEMGPRWFEVTAFRVGDPADRTVALLFEDITARIRAERDLRDLTATLERRVEERTESLRRLAVRLTGAEEAERRRIAHTLHDHLQQVLVGAKIWSGLAFQGRQEDRAAARVQLQDLLDQAADATRTLTMELCPPVLRDRGLAEALRWLGGSLRKSRRFQVAVDVGEDSGEGAGPDVPVQLEAFLYQAASELLLNAQKHSGGDAAEVRLERPAGGLRLTVRDEGRGCDPLALTQTAPGVHAGGFGLSALRERVRLLGGSFLVDAAPGAGAAIHLAWTPAALAALREDQPRAA